MSWIPRYPAIDATTQGAAYTFVLADAGTVVEYTGTSAANLTVPNDTTAPFPTGTVIEVLQQNTGQVTLVPGSGVTLNSPNGLKTRVRYSSLTMRKRGTNEWIVGGDSTT